MSGVPLPLASQMALSAHVVDEAQPAFRLHKLVIKPVLACTANCPTCENRQELHKSIRKTRQPTLTFEQWRKILAEAHDLGVQRLDVSGGEPTLCDYLADLVRIGRGYGWSVGVNTNGSLLTEDRVKALLDAGLSDISVSLYSSKPEVHNAMRRSRKLWEKATAGVRLLAEHGRGRDDFRIIAQTLICRENFRELDHILAMHHDLGADLVGLTYLEGDYERKYLLNEEEIAAFRADVQPRLLELTDRFDPAARERALRVLGDLFSERVLTTAEWARGEYRPARIKPTPCVRPREFALVLANGEVHPCNVVEYTHDPVMGNVFETPLSQLWRGRRWNGFREQLCGYCAYCPINLYMGVPLTKRGL